MSSPSTSYVIPVFPPATLPVVGGGLFPVRRVYCVGRNYADHAREMGGDPNREPPFFFSKPADAVTSLAEIPYAPATHRLDYEGELVVAIGLGGHDLPVDQAAAHIFGYAVGCDLTRRDLQAEARKSGRPWDMAKGFDFSGPCSAIVPASDLGHPAEGAITLAVNGEMKQEGDLSQMVWSVPEVVAALSRLVTLAPGDLIFTGTPSGVGPVVPGDTVVVTVESVGSLSFTLV